MKVRGIWCINKIVGLNCWKSCCCCCWGVQKKLRKKGRKFGGVVRLRSINYIITDHPIKVFTHTHTHTQTCKFKHKWHNTVCKCPFGWTLYGPVTVRTLNKRICPFFYILYSFISIMKIMVANEYIEVWWRYREGNGALHFYNIIYFAHFLYFHLFKTITHFYDNVLCTFVVVFYATLFFYCCCSIFPHQRSSFISLI